MQIVIYGMNNKSLLAIFGLLFSSQFSVQALFFIAVALDIAIFVVSEREFPFYAELSHTNRSIEMANSNKKRYQR